MYLGSSQWKHWQILVETLSLVKIFGARKLESLSYHRQDDTLSHFDCDRRMDKQTDIAAP